MPSNSPGSKAGPDHRKVVGVLLIVLSLSFAFSFALVPLYNVFCKVTGLNGKTDGRARVAQVMTVDESRSVKVTFTSTLNEHMPWTFYPLVKTLVMHPGEVRQVAFYAKNPSTHNTVGQAIPSISPGYAARYLHKTECFCFSRQALASGQSRNMVVRFYLDKNLPKDVHEMTLSYTLFDVSEQAG